MLKGKKHANLNIAGETKEATKCQEFKKKCRRHGRRGPRQSHLRRLTSAIHAKKLVTSRGWQWEKEK